jgi:hypothetical protein
MTAFNDTFYSVTFNASGQPLSSLVAGVVTIVTVNDVGPVVSQVSVSISSVEIFSAFVPVNITSIVPFFILDGVPLTEHNRTFSSSMEVKKIVNKRTNGASGVYFKTGGAKKTFNLNWTFVPGKPNNTVDFNVGRDYIFAKANDPRHHTLSIRNMDSNFTTPDTVNSYNVVITDYNESLKRRDVGGDDYYWDCSCVLREV